jgi:hypothetical protein
MKATRIMKIRAIGYAVCGFIFIAILLLSNGINYLDIVCGVGAILSFFIAISVMMGKA